MSAFEPGAGWVQAAAESRGVEEGLDVIIRVQNGVRTYWVREEPVPALPIEPYTIIRTTGKQGHEQRWALNPDGTFWVEVGAETIIPASALPSLITGFEVLAEPAPRVVLYEEQRRVARDVIARIRQLSAETHTPYGYHLDRVLTEYGVAL